MSLKLNSNANETQLSSACQIIGEVFGADTNQCTGRRNCITCRLGFKSLLIDVVQFKTRSRRIKEERNDMDEMTLVLEDGQVVQRILEVTGMDISPDTYSFLGGVGFACFFVLGVLGSAVFAGVVVYSKLTKEEDEHVPLLGVSQESQFIDLRDYNNFDNTKFITEYITDFQ